MTSVMRRKVSNSARTPIKSQGPNLATEARSLVRPCGCSRNHGAGGGHHQHQHHDHKPQPHPTPERPRKHPRSVIRPAPDSILEPHGSDVLADTIPDTLSSSQTSPVLETSMPVRVGGSRYITTLVWIPQGKPRKLSTGLSAPTGDASFTDAIYVKGTSGPNTSHGRNEARQH